MKTRKALLWLILPALLLLGSCFTGPTVEYRTLHKYDFVPNSPYVMPDDTSFSFWLDTGGETIRGYRYYGGTYKLNLSIRSQSPQLKSIKTVTLNRVTIQVEDNEFNMIERVNWINHSFRGEDEKIIWKTYFEFSEEDLAGVHSTGIIDSEAHKEKFDELAGTRTQSVWMTFHEIPIDFSRYKEILMYFDITVEYTTGETVRLEQEFLGIFVESIRQFNRAPWWWV